MGIALLALSAGQFVPASPFVQDEPGAVPEATSSASLRSLHVRLRADEKGIGRDVLRCLEEAEETLLKGIESGQIDVTLGTGFCALVVDIERIPLEERPEGFQAVDWYERAERIAEPLKNSEIRFTLAWLRGRANVALGRSEQGQALLQSAMETEKKPGLYRIRCALQLSQLARYQGEFDAAFTWIKEADATLVTLQTPPEYRASAACEIEGARFELHVALGLLDQAAEDLAKETALAESYENHASRARVALHKVDLLLISKRYSLASSEAQRILKGGALKKIPRSVISQLMLRRGIALAALGRQDPKWNEIAMKLVDQVLARGGMQPADHLSARTWRFELLLRQGRLEEARELRDNWRAESRDTSSDVKLDSLEDGAFLAALDTRLLLASDPTHAEVLTQLEKHESAYERFLEGWKSAPVREDGIAFLRYRNRMMVQSEYLRLILKAEGPPEERAEAALYAVQQAQCMGTTARQRNLVPLDLSTIRSTLTAGGAGVLVFAFGPDRSHVFAVDTNRIRVFEIGTDDSIATARENLVRVVRELPPNTSDDAARQQRRERLLALRRELTRVLLPEELHPTVLGWSAVHVVGGNHLGRLPIELLCLAGEGTLGEHVPITELKTLPQAATLLEGALAQEASRRNESPELAFLGAPEPSEAARSRWARVEDLPFTRSHLDALLRQLGSPRAEIFLGEDANRNAVSSPGLQQARFLWILAHGVSAPDFGSGSAIVLSPGVEGDDGLIRSSDFSNHTVPPFVLLSACGAGRGPGRMGDDRSADFAGALLGAGAACVVLSDFELELKAQVELMRILFEACVLRGMTPASAMCEWRRSLASDVVRSDPYYSQAYVEGLGHRPIPGCGD